MRSTSVSLQLTVSVPMGGMLTAIDQTKGWSCAVKATDLVLQIMQHQSQLIGTKTRRELLNRAMPAKRSQAISMGTDIASILHPNVDNTIRILTSYQTPDQIATLQPDDPMRKVMTHLNRLLGGRFRILIELNSIQIVLQDLAIAPLARGDVPKEWRAELLRTRVWDSDNRCIDTTDVEGSRVRVDLRQDERTYRRLMQEDARYISVSGSGYTNEAGARLQVLSAIEKVDPNTIPGLWVADTTEQN